MSTLCDVCLQIFQSGTSPLGQGKSMLRRRGLMKDLLYTEGFPHHQSSKSLQRSVDEVCYICRLFTKHLKNWYSTSDLESIKDDKPFTIYGYRGDVSIESQHPHPFEVRVSWGKVLYNGAKLVASPAPGLTNSIELQGLPSSTGSLASRSQALEWFQGCSKFHARCNTAANASSWFPTRLIDLGWGASGSPRLIETRRILPLRGYATLSYCWGSAATVKLTHKTMQSFLVHLPESELPRTFRDAFEVARHFSIRYLWIDSLCIIQDSVEDWTAESSVMGLIYKRGVCNFAAAASKDSHGGLFFDRDPQPLRPAVVVTRFNDCPPSTYTVSDMEMWEEGVSKAVLNTRGWVLQERFLSPRILHFGSDQLYWECYELQACEAFPRGLPPTARIPGEPLLMKEWDFKNPSPKLRPPWQSPLPEFDGYRLWNMVVETYSRAQLTCSKDKLVAISAVAKEAREGLQDEYIAGLWRRHLAWELDWEVAEVAENVVPTRPSTYRAPTWSWASVDGEINTTEYGSDESLLVDIVKAGTTPLGDDDTGGITDGFVRLRGLLYPILLGYKVFLTAKAGVRVFTREVPRPAMPIFDIDDDEFATRECYALLHHWDGKDIRDQDWGYSSLVALLLVYDGESRTYRRVGKIRLRNPFGEPCERSMTGEEAEGQTCSQTNSTMTEVDDPAGDPDDLSIKGERSSMRSRLFLAGLRQLQDLVENRWHNPDVPCEAYDEVFGYTITIV